MCTKQFRSSAALVNHMSRMHAKRPWHVRLCSGYSCAACGINFFSVVRCRNHIRRQWTCAMQLLLLKVEVSEEMIVHLDSLARSERAFARGHGRAEGAAFRFAV
eukprot:10860453-Prorocentrum_lima.AAC.1